MYKCEEVPGRIEKFIELSSKKRQDHMDSQGYTYCKAMGTTRDGNGRKYVRIISTEIQHDGTIMKRGVYCFIDMENGNVLKAAGYKAPEKKNPRSNIFDDDFGMSGVDHHGAIYLR